MEFIDLKRQYREYKNEILPGIQDIMENARFILGKEVKELEDKLAEYTGAKYALGVSSGTDALLIALMAEGVGEGDEVITVPYTFIATAEVISLLGAKPVFVDIDEKDYNIDVQQIEAKITPRTKGIMPVSLYGQTPDMDAINAIARKHGLFVLEDACQSFGSIYKGRKSCNLSDIGATSFFPSKPLGGYGDGGMLFTNDEELNRKMRLIFNHGQAARYMHECVGLNGRLDTMQALVLLVKFAHFEDEARKRQEIGKRYTELLQGSAAVTPQVSSTTDRHVYAQYSIRVKNRDKVLEHLKSKGIPTAIHYPVPIHLQEAYASLKHQKGDFPVSERVSSEIFSLPMHPFLTEQEMQEIAGAVKEAAE